MCVFISVYAYSNKCLWYVFMSTFQVPKPATRGPFYPDGLTLVPAWLSNNIEFELWDEMASQTTTVQPLKFGNG